MLSEKKLDTKDTYWFYSYKKEKLIYVLKTGTLVIFKA